MVSPEQSVSNAVLQVGDLSLHRCGSVAIRAGRAIPLAPKEFLLLEALMLRPGQYVKRSSLEKMIWEESHSPSALRVLMNKLRQKVDVGYSRTMIETCKTRWQGHPGWRIK